MIQRIQSLWLLVAAVLMSLPVFFPSVKFFADLYRFSLYAFGLRDMTDPAVSATIYPTVLMGILIVCAIILPVIIIFLYKNRLLQIRLCFVEMVLMLGAFAFILYYGLRGSSLISELFQVNNFSFTLPAFMPLVALFFVWLALRGIVKDQKLVKSLNRIR